MTVSLEVESGRVTGKHKPTRKERHRQDADHLVYSFVSSLASVTMYCSRKGKWALACLDGSEWAIV